MNDIFIPTYSFWANGNSWYGSKGNARFYIRPLTPEGGEDTVLDVQLWRGPLTLELSEVLEHVTFPFSEGEESLPAMTAWLTEQAARINQE